MFKSQVYNMFQKSYQHVVKPHQRFSFLSLFGFFIWRRLSLIFLLKLAFSCSIDFALSLKLYWLAIKALFLILLTYDFKVVWLNLLIDLFIAHELTKAMCVFVPGVTYFGADHWVSVAKWDFVAVYQIRVHEVILAGPVPLRTEVGAQGFGGNDPCTNVSVAVGA